MKSPENSPSAKNPLLPDIIQNIPPAANHTIDHVGMEEMEMLISISASGNKILQLPAKVSAFVSLDDPTSKGIHMSRLYTLIYDLLANQTAHPNNLAKVTEDLIASQKGISSTAALSISFEYMRQQPALLSPTTGIRHYPITFSLSKHPNTPVSFSLSFTITYSSACPCSSALSEQVIKNHLQKILTESTPFKQAKWLQILEETTILQAIPHSQRSHATIELSFQECPQAFLLDSYLDEAEAALKTRVQTSVKREDEQEFARINAQNLMFCEDAARLLKDFYLTKNYLSTAKIKISHQESLHAHNAVAITTITK